MFLYLFLVIVVLVNTSFHMPVNNCFISSEAAVLIDARTGEVLFEKSAHKIMYPASTTKVMTALLLIEYAEIYGFDEYVYISENAVSSISRRASNIGLLPGERLTLRECLYAIMLASANEVCVAVAEHIAGSVEAFSEKMNERAVETGALKTHFTNPTGLHERNHVTTAYDIALIKREAAAYDIFIETISTKFYEPLNISNRNLLIQDGEFYREYVVGGKTGFTSAAGHTLVTYAKINGSELICVVLRTSNLLIYEDTIKLLKR